MCTCPKASRQAAQPGSARQPERVLLLYAAACALHTTHLHGERLKMQRETRRSLLGRAGQRTCAAAAAAGPRFRKSGAPCCQQQLCSPRRPPSDPPVASPSSYLLECQGPQSCAGEGGASSSQHRPGAAPGMSMHIRPSETEGLVIGTDVAGTRNKASLGGPFVLRSSCCADGADRSLPLRACCYSTPDPLLGCWPARHSAPRRLHALAGRLRASSGAP